MSLRRGNDGSKYTQSAARMISGLLRLVDWSWASVGVSEGLEVGGKVMFEDRGPLPQS